MVGACLGFTTAIAHAGGSLRAGAMSGISPNGSSSASATSQSATSATDNTAATISSSAAVQQAQASLTHSIQALQAMQAAQAAARTSALAGASNLGVNPNTGQTLQNVADGLGGNAALGYNGGLVPSGSALTPTSNPSVQVVKLGSSSTSNNLTLNNGGTVIVPTGTPGSDTVSVSGAGTVTSTGGTVTATAGSITTSSGATLSATGGGTVAFSSSGATLTVGSTTTLTSNVAGTVTLTGGTTATLAAGQPTTIPAGSTISFSGSTGGTVTVASSSASAPSTVTLNGAGTVSLANAASNAAGGTITTNAGTTTFTSGATTSLPAGSTIALAGAGSVSFSGASGDSLSVLINTGANGNTTNTAANYTTTGQLLSTTSFDLPASWTGVIGLSQTVDTSNSSATQYVDTVTQDAQQAVLQWSSFDIGKNTTLDFDQSAGGANVGQWVAINEIINPTLNPTQILGSINAPGQVYVVNQNGIIFGGSSEVNTHALVASSLPINTNLVEQGLLSGAVTDDQFLFSQLTIPSLTSVSSPTAVFTPPAAPAGGDGDVVVQPGAVLQSPTNEEHVGGRVALVGPVVENDGTIETPDGQTILAAGLQVGFNAHLESDPTLRGLDVYVGEVNDPTYDNGATTDASGTPLGTAINNGDIEVQRADLTMTGATVDQNGVVDGSTSVTLNGRIDLLADYDAVVTNFNGALAVDPAKSGAVNFGANSVTQILPETSSSETVVGSALTLPSVVDIQGLTIYMGTNSLLWAPGASIDSSSPAVDLTGADLESGVNFDAGDWSANGAIYDFLNTSGQVYLDTGATIDVAGTPDVSASVSEDIVAVQLLGPQLADYPTQRTGDLRGTTVYIDLFDYGVSDGQAWIGTPLADASGYVGLVQHDVGELTINGGTVAINAGQSVALQTGSQINVSGGYINYQGATVQTTEVNANGQIVDISQANPDLVYGGIYSGSATASAKWNVLQVFLNDLVSGSQYDPGYIQGGNAGSLIITAPTMALQGQLLGSRVAGINQRSTAAQINSTFSSASFPGTNFEPILDTIFGLPQAGILELLFTQNQNSADKIVPPSTSPDVTFESTVDIEENPQPSIGAFTQDSSGNPSPLPTALQNSIVLSQDWVNLDGFGNLTIDTSASGDISVPAGIDLNAGPAGSITFRAANIDIESSLDAPGGTLNFTAYDVSPFNPNGQGAPPDFTRGNFTLGAGASLNAAGSVVDDTSGSASALAPETTAGGSVSIAGYSATLDSGSTIDVAGGAYVSASGVVSYGNGGSITIAAGTDPQDTGIIGGNLNLGASYFSGQSLVGYAGLGATGASLTIQAPLLQVGGTAPTTEPEINFGSTSAEVGSQYTETAQTLTFSSDFFNQGGFSGFTLTGLGAELAPGGTPNGSYASAVVIASDAQVDPTVINWIGSLNGSQLTLTTMTTQEAAEIPASQRAPVNLTFNTYDIAASTGAGTQGAYRLQTNVVVQSGAQIAVPGNSSSSVAFRGDTVSYGGSTYVPGGKISVGGASSSGGIYLSSGQATVDLLPGSILSVQGETLLTTNAQGLKTGSVLNGGSISVSGNIVAQSGAVLNVSGWSDVVDVSRASLGETTTTLQTLFQVPSREDSNAGLITLAGGELLYNDATLEGYAGGSNAQTTAPGLSAGPTTAQGGQLIITSSTVFGKGGSATPADMNVFVSQDESSLPTLPAQIIGGSLTDSSGNTLSNGGGFVAADDINAGDFEQVTLGGNVQFSGSVNLTASGELSVASGGFISAATGGQVTFTAPYVALGSTFTTPATAQAQAENGSVFTEGSGNFYDSPVAGDGVLTVDASILTDLGNLEFFGISTLDFNGTEGLSGFVASTMAGDIRGDGTVNVAGIINLNAREIYPPTDSTFTLAAYDTSAAKGTVNIYQPANNVAPSAPLSAGGTLNIYASVINQGGVLRAPIGTINLGWDGLGSAPVNLVTNLAPSATQVLTLNPGSLTTVSAQGATIPYGYINSAGDWIDPAGNDITAGGSVGLPAKTINFSAQTITTDFGSTIDISGGGDLYANVFVSGLGGTNNILTATSSYAIVPGYSSDYAYAPYDAVSGYATSAYSRSLQIGAQIELAGSSTLAQGLYTLLPAGYALLPGGVLVTPEGGAVVASEQEADGSSLVGGARVNGLNGAEGQEIETAYDVASQAVVNSRAEYDTSLANTYFPVSAPQNNVPVPRLPVDAGQVKFIASTNLSLPDSPDTLLSAPGAGGLGSEVDLASPANINIYNGDDTQSEMTGDLNLSAQALDEFGAESLLIGGYRQTSTVGTSVTVLTNDLTVNDAGAALSGPDIILVSNENLTIDSGSEIDAGQVASASSAAAVPTLLLSGDGALLRVSASSSAQIVRSGFTPGASDLANITIGTDATVDGATVAGATSANAGTIIIDSTNETSLAAQANLAASALQLDSGAISIELPTLATPIATTPPGLVLSSTTLGILQQTVQNLQLLSYSSLDFWGSGAIGGAAVNGTFPVQSFSLQAGEIRGFDNGAETVSINAQNVTLGGLADSTVPGAIAAPAGGLAINARTINIDSGALQIDQFSQVTLTAGQQISLGNGTGSLIVTGALTLSAPAISATPVTPLTPAQEQQDVTAPAATVQTISATGALSLTTPGGTPSGISDGLGANLTLSGSSVEVANDILLPSGQVTITATQGNISVDSGGVISAAGMAETMNDLTEYTNGGQVTLTTSSGNVTLASGSTVSVAADSGGGNAGGLTVNAEEGSFNVVAGAVLGQGGQSGEGGSFTLDVSSLSSLDTIEPILNSGGFTQSQSFRVRSGDVAVDGVATASHFSLETDAGSITVNGEIDASGATGGDIDLQAAQSVTLADGSLLTVEGTNFNNASEGGSIELGAGSDINGTASTAGYVDIAAGSTVNLTVDAAAGLGDNSGVLHLRAPQFADGSGLQVDPIQGNIVGASSVVVEGYKIYVAPNGSIDSVEGSATTSTPDDGTVYGDAEGFADNTTAILTAVLGGAPTAAQSALYQITPGAEIINPNVDTAANPTQGDLTLASNWDLSTFRFGPDDVAGDLTLRAGGNIIFDYGASLSDGFTPSASFGLWKGTLMTGPSWSYQIVAGADFSAAGVNQVLPKSELLSVDAQNNPVLNAQGAEIYNGSVLIGEGATELDTTGSPISIASYYQTIRTGSGGIAIAAGGDVQLLNNLATIYTAGQAVADPTLGGTFQIPTLKQTSTSLGNYSPIYPAQYSDDGGNVVITAQNNIGHYNADGSLDSSLELPTNWLYRQGAVATNGSFGTNSSTGQVESTSWWVDFSNFFEGVGALGGGNVTLVAGNDIDNVDAVVPTNARMPGVSGTQAIAPNASSLVELGGGDLVVEAGDDINGGVYYVERGQGTLAAGDQILTNSSRAAILPDVTTIDPESELGTTLFLGGADGSGNGSASFTVSAGGNVLLGPVANPFLLPQGIDNTFAEKTYFSTYAPNDAVSVSSLTGAVTLQDNSDQGAGSLLDWYLNVSRSSPRGTSGTAANAEIWLGLVENASGITDLGELASLMAPTLNVIAFAGDIDIHGSLTLAPSPVGSLNLLAAGSINGFQPSGLDISGYDEWGSSTINVSDASPALIAGFADPDAPPAGSVLSNSSSTAVAVLGLNEVFLDVTGATQDVPLQTQEIIHDAALLHANDDTGPIHIYADTGNISGIELYAPKETDIIAGEDITDIAFYLQNLSADNISLVQAGRDIIAYDVNSPLRLDAQTSGNQFIGESSLALEGTGLGQPEAGDIQIAGPGTLEVLAGRNFNLGIGPSSPNGIGAGLTSIGNTSNPRLPFAGADIIAASGLGSASGLDSLNFTDAEGTGFVDEFLNPNLSAGEPDIYLPDLATLMELSASDSIQDVWNAFGMLSTARQDALALEIFYLVLRDAGRDHNNASSPNAGTYTEGFDALNALFLNSNGSGNISLTSREIKTTNGGNISLLARNGSIDVGVNNTGSQAVDQGILTVDGGNINIFADGSVNVGTSRIFTLHGGNEIIWSTHGDIDAGAASKTVQSAPPTRVLVYPTSGDVETDLAGLATGGGIGVLETVVGAPPGDVDLIAPRGVVNAGDAGIRASGNLNIAAVQVLNASNISVGGKSSGVPAGASAPNIGALSAASSAAGSAENAATEGGAQNGNQAQSQTNDLPSIITVDVLGYGGDDAD